MSLSRALARSVLDTRYTDLTPESLGAAKNIVLDSVGCMLGGRTADTLPPLVSASRTDLGGGPRVVSMVGCSDPAGLLPALLVNGAALRYLDYNDVQFSAAGVSGGHGHNSELVPLVLALAERYGLDGRAMLTALVVGYDVSARFTEAVLGRGLEARGWSVDSRASFAVPFVVGHMLGMSEEQVSSAVGLSLTRGMLLQAIDSRSNPSTMSRNLRFPIGSFHAFVNCHLTRHGLEGPHHVVESPDGVMGSVLDGDLDLAEIARPVDGTAILRAGLKKFAASYATHGHIAATLAIATTHGVRAEDVEEVRIQVTTKGYEHAGHPSRRFPRNKEEADHSSYYVTAAALLFGAVGPNQYSAELYSSPQVHSLLEVIEVSENPELNGIYPSAIVDIRTSRGETYRHHVAEPPGHPRNRLSAEEIGEKFLDMASPCIGTSTAERLREAILALEEADAVSLIGSALRAAGLGSGRRSPATTGLPAPDRAR